MATKIIVLDDDHIFRETLCNALAGRGYEVWSAENGKEAIRLASERSFDAALIDMKMPGMDGFQVMKELKEIQPSIRGIILTGYGSIQDAVKTIKLGGYHYLTKPCNMKEIEEVLEKVSEEKKEGETPLHGEVYQGMVGVSRAIKEVIWLIQRVKDSSVPVLICGESGTGKELVARALHFDSIRKARPFVAINCASLKPELLENELFGHVRGAFTGALEFKEGLVKTADRGTLFIDEIADMDLVVQAGLLRFIETGLFRPLGSSREIRVDTRIVAAINRDIEEEVRAKRFREDLYYRLNVCRINIPPLRERREDIPLLARHFISSVTDRDVSLSKGAMERLITYHWPGNVRQLFHVLQRTIILNRDATVITGAHIDQSLHTYETREIKNPSAIYSLEESEKRYILSSLEANNWNISRTAKILGIDRRTLQRKMCKFSLKRPSA